MFNSDDDGHKELLLNAIVHAADIANPTLHADIHYRWSLDLLREFNMQYEEELALGMAPTLYMNAQAGSPEQGKVNLAFIDSCVFPLWSLMSTFLDGLDGCLHNIQSNRAIWLKMMDPDATPAAAATAAADQQHQLPPAHRD